MKPDSDRFIAIQSCKFQLKLMTIAYLEAQQKIQHYSWISLIHGFILHTTLRRLLALSDINPHWILFNEIKFYKNIRTLSRK